MQPESATIEPMISNFVTFEHVVKRYITIIMAQRLEYKFACDIIVYVAPHVRKLYMPIKPIDAKNKSLMSLLFLLK